MVGHLGKYCRSFFISFMIIMPIFVAYYGLTIGHMYYHEEVHVSIYESYGVPADYYIDFYEMNAFTYPVNNTLAHERCPSDSRCEMLHQQNEIMGYNISILINVIFVTVGALIVITWMIFLMLASILKYLSMNEEVLE